MVILSSIIKELEKLAPPEGKCSWDNVGLLVGDKSQKISRVFVCLDITSENVQSAVSFGADLIVSHHPLIFDPLKSVTEGTVVGSIIRELIRHNISAYCMHTNFDIADGGMNDLLAKRLGLENIRPFTPEECVDEYGEPLEGIGRVGHLNFPITLDEFIHRTVTSLGCTALKYCGDLDDSVQTVAVCSGSGGSEMYAAYHSGADVFVTGDLKHDHGRIAKEIGLNIVDAGHFETENTICGHLLWFFETIFPELMVESSYAKPYFKSI